MAGFHLSPTHLQPASLPYPYPCLISGVFGWHGRSEVWGTSVGDLERIRNVASRVAETKRQGTRSSSLSPPWRARRPVASVGTTDHVGTDDRELDVCSHRRAVSIALLAIT